jgi:hypothetical protein
MASAASATLSASVTGLNTPGTNTYTITLFIDTADLIRGVIAGVSTTGTYTGVFTDPVIAGFTTNLSGAGVLNEGVPTGTGRAGSWGHVAGTPQPGGAYIIGTVEITVVAGDTVMPDFSGILDGFVTNSFTTVGPNGPLTGVTIIPEPTTASLLGLGIVGLVLAGRKRRS